MFLPHTERYSDTFSYPLSHSCYFGRRLPRLPSSYTIHSHGDHAGGNADTLKAYDIPVIGGKDCARVTTTPSHNSTFNIGNIKVRALHTPCHTQDSICYLFEDGEDKAVFTGDTLFIAGMLNFPFQH